MPKLLKSGKLSFTVKETRYWRYKLLIRNPLAFFLICFRKPNLRQIKLIDKSEERYTHLLEFGLYTLSSMGRLISWDGSVLDKMHVVSDACMQCIEEEHPWKVFLTDILNLCLNTQLNRYVLESSGLTKEIIQYIADLGNPERLIRKRRLADLDCSYFLNLLLKFPLVALYLLNTYKDTLVIGDTRFRTQKVHVSDKGKLYHNVFINDSYSIYTGFLFKFAQSIIDKHAFVDLYLPLDPYQPVVFAEREFRFGCIILPDLGEY